MSIVRLALVGAALCTSTAGYAACENLNGRKQTDCLVAELDALQAVVATLSDALMALDARSGAADARHDQDLQDLTDELAGQDARVSIVEASYVTDKDIADFVDEQWLRDARYIRVADLEDLQIATTTWVDAQGFLDAAYLVDHKYMTRSQVSALGYATEAWVASQDFGGVPGLSDYLWVDPVTDRVVFEGANVHITDGTGDTPCGTFGFEPCTGLGNLIVGYNEAGVAPADGKAHGHDRTGSHNLVTGRYHDYTSFGGRLGGYGNRVDASEGAVLGGWLSTVSAPQSTILGGAGLVATEPRDLLPLLGALDDVIDVTATDVIVEGANLHVRNGSGTTYNSENGLGNLIIGYDTHTPFGSAHLDASGAPDATTGSHNVVLGDYHSYPQSGGLVGGYDNTLVGDMAVVATGTGNAAGTSGFIATGRFNDTDDTYGAVISGHFNTASGRFGAVVGGYDNEASGESSAVLGGEGNAAWGLVSTIAGGRQNGAGGTWATVAGGWGHTMQGAYSAAIGGSGFFDHNVTGLTYLGGIAGSYNSSQPYPQWAVRGLGEWDDRIMDLEDVVNP